MDPTSPEVEGLLLDEGDILFNRTNSAELVGKSAVYYNVYPKSIFASYLIKIKPFTEFIIPEILSEYINSVLGKNYITKVRSQQVGQANVNGSKLAAMPVPLIPYDEQLKIKEIMDYLDSIYFKILNDLLLMTVKADSLKQSILKKAFEGRLVSQNHSDEPASILLEYIKAQKTKQRRLM
jgi:type I restriction enzyme S subunit